MERDGHATIEDRLRRTRQRYTAGRRQLVDALAGAGRPLTIPELLDAGVSQSQSSVYRNLAILEQCDVVRRLASAGDDTARFELAEDLTEHHHHLVCSACGAIADISLSPEIEAALGAAVEEARTHHDFSVDAHRFDLVGSCADCA